MAHYGNEKGPSTYDLLSRWGEEYWGVSYDDYQFDLVWERMVCQEETRTGKKYVNPVHLTSEGQPYTYLGYENNGSRKQVLINDFQPLEGKVLVYTDEGEKHTEWRELLPLVPLPKRTDLEGLVGYKMLEAILR